MSALRNPWPAAGWLAITLLLLPGCGGGDRAAPDPLELAIAKPDTLGGDQQVGVAGAELELALRVVVTRDSLPAAGVPVVWRTFEGSLTPASPVSDANGISTARWRLQRLFAQQVAGASLDFTGAPGVTFTAIATPDPRAWNTVLVGPDGNRFDPAELTIEAGETVNWFWPPGSAGHNVVPDDRDSPPQSGPPVGYPKYHSYRFTAPGVYRYHCITHGAAGGEGMSGTITVVTSCGTSCKE
jgi:plastocyanin